MPTNIKKSTINFIIFLAVGAVLGNLIGELFGIFFSGTFQKFLADGIDIGIKSLSIDLRIIRFSIGFLFNITFLSIAGIFAGGYIYYRLKNGKD